MYYVCIMRITHTTLYGLMKKKMNNLKLRYYNSDMYTTTNIKNS